MVTHTRLCGKIKTIQGCAAKYKTNKAVTQIFKNIVTHSVGGKLNQEHHTKGYKAKCKTNKAVTQIFETLQHTQGCKANSVGGKPRAPHTRM